MCYNDCGLKFDPMFRRCLLEQRARLFYGEYAFECADTRAFRACKRRAKFIAYDRTMAESKAAFRARVVQFYFIHDNASTVKHFVDEGHTAESIKGILKRFSEAQQNVRSAADGSRKS